MLNKDTQLYGSFSNNPTNNGCRFFNHAFRKFKLDAIYKSFFSDDLSTTLVSVRHLDFKGFGLSRPFKCEMLDYLDFMDDSVKSIGSCNTVKLENKKFFGYNTDWVGAYNFIKKRKLSKLNIIGLGGFGKSVFFAAKKLGIDCEVFHRNDIKNIRDCRDEYFMNCTPIEIKDKKNKIYDARPITRDGKEIAKYQAIEQFKIYTGIEYE